MNTIALKLYKENSKSIFFDIAAISFIFFIPALSHTVGYPLYYFEPMRVVLLLSLAHTSRNNAYILALTIPLFSYFVGSHPSIVKALLIGIELSTNIYLFTLLSKKYKNVLLSAGISILIAKILYYALKFALLNRGVLQGELVTTPFGYQAAVLILVSFYMYWVSSMSNKR